jgi:hypothetical protein
MGEGWWRNPRSGQPVRSGFFVVRHLIDDDRGL